MEIVIKIKIENDEPVKVEVEQTEEKKENQAYSVYARFFDEASPCWTKDSEQNLMFLKLQEQYANDKLKQQGYLFQFGRPLQPNRLHRHLQLQGIRDR